jgi:hypothetical protein
MCESRSLKGPPTSLVAILEATEWSERDPKATSTTRAHCGAAFTGRRTN